MKLDVENLNKPIESMDAWRSIVFGDKHRNYGANDSGLPLGDLACVLAKSIIDRAKAKDSEVSPNCSEIGL